MKPTPKFEIGDRVRDTVRDRFGTITAMYWDEEDAIRLVDKLVELCDKPVKTIYTK